MANCTICHEPIMPSAKARADKYGQFTSPFTTHAFCAVSKRSHEAHQTMTLHRSNPSLHRI